VCHSTPHVADHLDHVGGSATALMTSRCPGRPRRRAWPHRPGDGDTLGGDSTVRLAFRKRTVSADGSHWLPPTHRPRPTAPSWTLRPGPWPVAFALRPCRAPARCPRLLDRSYSFVQLLFPAHPMLLHTGALGITKAPPGALAQRPSSDGTPSRLYGVGRNLPQLATLMTQRWSFRP